MNVDRQQVYVRCVQYFHENPQNMLIGINAIYTWNLRYQELFLIRDQGNEHQVVL